MGCGCMADHARKPPEQGQRVLQRHRHCCQATAGAWALVVPASCSGCSSSTATHLRPGQTAPAAGSPPKHGSLILDRLVPGALDVLGWRSARGSGWVLVEDSAPARRGTRSMIPSGPEAERSPPRCPVLTLAPHRGAACQGASQTPNCSGGQAAASSRREGAFPP